MSSLNARRKPVLWCARSAATRPAAESCWLKSASASRARQNNGRQRSSRRARPAKSHRAKKTAAAKFILGWTTRTNGFNAKTQRRGATVENEIFVFRSPSPFILSPPPSPFAPARSRRSTAKTDRRGNHHRPILVLRVIVRQIQSRELPSRRQTILLLLGGEGRDEGERYTKPQPRGQIFIEEKALHAVWTTEK
jgi:hypothetical protein